MILHVHVHDDAVGRGARLVGDADPLEVAEIVEAALGPVDENLVVGVALAHVELAADDVVAGPAVPADVDALDIDARPFLDHVAELDRAGRRIAGADGADLREGIAAASHLAS